MVVEVTVGRYPVCWPQMMCWQSSCIAGHLIWWLAGESGNLSEKLAGLDASGFLCAIDHSC